MNKGQLVKEALRLNPYARLCSYNKLLLDQQPVVQPDGALRFTLCCDHEVDLEPDDVPYWETHKIPCAECQERVQDPPIVDEEACTLQCPHCERVYQREEGLLRYNIAQWKCFCRKTITKQRGEMVLFDFLQTYFGEDRVFCNFVHKERAGVRNRRTSDFYVKLDDMVIVIELDDVSHGKAVNRASDIHKIELLLERAKAGEEIKMLHIDQEYLQEFIVSGALKETLETIVKDDETLFFLKHEHTSPSRFSHILDRDDVYTINVRRRK